jgi:tetratricopeptide (TPR) repeat protein
LLLELDDRSLLKSYLKGNVAAKTGHNDEAIAFFEAGPKSGEYLKIPSLDYLLGCAKLSRMDKDSPAAFENYVKEFRGTNFIKDAYLKLAYYYLLQNDQGKYDYYIKLVKTKGYNTDGKDQEALFEANDVKPDIDLLKARLYFDGGYYAKALAELAGKDENSFKLLRDKIEFWYRLGRIYDKTGKFNDAIANYQKAINLGKETKYYFAANSALNIGLIFEQKRDFKRAGDYYNQALGMHDHQYQNDVDNDAKAGLKRIGQ